MNPEDKVFLSIILGVIFGTIVVICFLVVFDFLGKVYGDDRWQQSSFQCVEDAALVFSKWDADRLVCVNLDDIREGRY